MKRFKKLGALLMVVTMLLLTITPVFAATVDISSDKNFEFSYDDFINDKIMEITVNDVEGDYDLYYQYIEVPAMDAADIDEIISEMLDYILANIDKLSKMSTSEKQAFVDKLNDYQEAIKDLLPEPVSLDWEAAVGNEAEFAGDVDTGMHVLWVMLDPDEGDEIYGGLVISVENEVESQFTMTIQLGAFTVDDIEYLLEVYGGEEPVKTGDNIMFIAIGSVAVAGLGLLSIKKLRESN